MSFPSAIAAKWWKELGSHILRELLNASCPSEFLFR